MKKKINHIVLLRVLAIILVVLGHAVRNVQSPNPHMFSPVITTWWEVAIKEYVYSFHMPLFFWISGFVFYYSVIENRRKYSIVSQLFNKSKRLLLPMYSTSFLILLPTIIFFGHITGSMVLQMKLFILAKNNEHLWFLKELFIIFCVIIPLYSFNKSDNNIFYVILLVLFGLLLPFQELLPDLIKGPLKHSIFFLVGCLSRKFEGLIDKFNSIFFFCLFFVLHSFLIQSISIIVEHLQQNVYWHVYWYVYWYIFSFAGIYFMYFFTKSVSSYLISTKTWSTIVMIDSATYSIYLFHLSFLFLVLFANYHYPMIPVVRVSLSVILGIAFSMLLHRAFSRNKLISQLFSIRYVK